MTIDEIRCDVAFWQRLLRLAGYNPGVIDGIRGKNTKAAEARWEAACEASKTELGAFDERSEKNLATIIPQAQVAVRKWLALAVVEAEKHGVSVKLIDGTRSYAEQNKLYAKRPKVTNARGGYSWHNFGLAVDFGVFRRKEYLAESNMYTVLGALARKVDGLEWGGDWTSFKDYPHIQLRMFATTAAARAKF